MRTLLHPSSKIIKLTAFQVGVPSDSSLHLIILFFHKENLDSMLSFELTAIPFSPNLCSIHVPDEGVYQLVDYLWVCGDRSVSAFLSRFQLQRVDDTENSYV